MSADLIASAIGAGIGAASSVFIVFRVLMAALKEDINEAKRSAAQAHRRIDRHIESSH